MDRPLYSTIVGYYSHREGARYVSPLHSGSRFPDLVDLHESTHADLALSNVTDGIGRLFAAVLRLGEERLSPEDRGRIDKLFAEMHQHTVWVHEVLATYMSFLLFTIGDCARGREARKSLPPFYERALSAGERAFGAVDDNRTARDSSKVPTLAYSAAVAALNLPYTVEMFRFGDLDLLVEFISENSPNKRFTTILSALRPHWDTVGLFSKVAAGWKGDLSNEQVRVEYQAALFAELRKHIPQLVFFSKIERPTLLGEIWATVMSDGVSRGYEFLGGRTVSPASPETPRERMGASVVFPGLPPEYPLDLSLSRLQYDRGTIETLKLAVSICADEGLCLQCHVYMPDGIAGLLSCFCIDKDGSMAGTPAFGVVCSFAELLSVLRQTKPGCIVLKMDQRCVQSARLRLAKTGHPVFILMCDTRPRAILDLFEKEYAGTRISLLTFGLMKNGAFRAMVAKVEGETLFYLTPLTQWGVVVIEIETQKLNNILRPQTPEEVLSLFGEFGKFVPHMITWCYAS